MIFYLDFTLDYLILVNIANVYLNMQARTHSINTKILRKILKLTLWPFQFLKKINL